MKITINLVWTHHGYKCKNLQLKEPSHSDTTTPQEVLTTNFR